MGVKLAALLVVIAIVGATVGVGFYDWRAGVIVFSLLVGAVGLWHLSTQE